MKGVCHLCEIEKDLAKAHIIPEPFYRELYDESHKIAEVNLNDLSNTVKRSKGIYDPNILCRRCDNDILNKLYDDYGSKVCWGYEKMDLNMKTYHSSSDPNVKWIIEENVDSRRMKLFFLSILWRAHLSGMPSFKEVDLGLKHSQRIKTMIKNNDPGTIDEYPVLLLHYAIGDSRARRLISPVRKGSKNGKTFYFLLLSGVLVLWYISENQVPNNLKSLVVAKENKFSVLHSPIQGFDLFAEIFNDDAFRSLGKQPL
jgi:hypothetical protein